MSGSEIAIRSIQHYLYCPHRWGLLEIDRAWAENAFVTKANQMHERVHDPDRHYTLRGRKVFTSVSVFNDNPDYGIYGVTDCIEAAPASDGTIIGGCDGKFELCIVEYKPTSPKSEEYNSDDAMQVFAQKICVDNIFKTDCRAVLYYADIKKRVELPFKAQYSEFDTELKKILNEMRNNLKSGTIPPVISGQKCSGCSMKDLCMPKIKHGRGVKYTIEKLTEDAE